MAWRMSDGWRKVASYSSLSFRSADLFNVLTGEETYVVTRDYDRWDISECDAPEWDDVPVDDEARRAWNRKNLVIADGSRVMVVKGRKIEPGYSGVVEKIRKIRDCYGRHVADYVVFEDGRSTNIENCILIL